MGRTWSLTARRARAINRGTAPLAMVVVEPVRSPATPPWRPVDGTRVFEHCGHSRFLPQRSIQHTTGSNWESTILSRWSADMDPLTTISSSGIITCSLKYALTSNAARNAKSLSAISPWRSLLTSPAFAPTNTTRFATPRACRATWRLVRMLSFRTIVLSRGASSTGDHANLARSLPFVETAGAKLAGRTGAAAIAPNVALPPRAAIAAMSLFDDESDESLAAEPFGERPGLGLGEAHQRRLDSEGNLRAESDRLLQSAKGCVAAVGIAGEIRLAHAAD